MIMLNLLTDKNYINLIKYSCSAIYYCSMMYQQQEPDYNNYSFKLLIKEYQNNFQKYNKEHAQLSINENIKKKEIIDFLLKLFTNEYSYSEDEIKNKDYTEKDIKIIESKMKNEEDNKKENIEITKPETKIEEYENSEERKQLELDTNENKLLHFDHKINEIIVFNELENELKNTMLKIENQNLMENNNEILEEQISTQNFISGIEVGNRKLLEVDVKINNFIKENNNSEEM